MATHMVASDYGDISLCSTDDESPTSQLPNLQFEDGDLLIKLGSEPRDWLIVHREVVHSTCELLAISLSERWSGTESGPQTIQHPTTGREISVWIRALKQADGTYVLEGQDVDADERERSVPFSQSVLTQPRWPVISDWHNCLELTKKALRVIFALLYGAHLSPIQIEGSKNVEYWEPSIEVSDITVLVCAYAEYWGCLDVVGPRMLEICKSTPGFWISVANQPEQLLRFATKLKNAELYYDALRHRVAQAHMNDDWKGVVDLGKHSEKQVRVFYEPQMKLLEEKLELLKTNLDQLQLNTIYAKGSTRGWHTAYIRNIHTAPSKLDRAAEAAQYIYGKFLAYHLSGEKVTRVEDDLMYEKAGRFNLLLRELEQVADSRHPGAVFDPAAVTHFAKVFRLSGKEKNDVHGCLNRLACQAAKLIRDAFPSYNSDETTFGNRYEDCNTDRSHFDAHLDGYSTYLTVPNKVPWTQNNDTTGGAGGRAIVPGISTVEISAELLQTLVEHYHVEPETEDEDDTSVGESGV